MENYTYTNMLTGYRDRVLRIALFDVFAMLDAKQLKDGKGKPVDCFGLGLLSLLFFFESMLLRVKKRGIHELALFLQVTDESLYETVEDYEKLAKAIVETFRPPRGKRNARSFYNYETRQMEEVEYAILKTDDWDTVKNVQYYTLDEQGLELIFATKEYFSEFQISISQMMLRKQLEKGEFLGALRQVDEMRISVNSIKENIYRIKHDIQRNITSEDTYSRYKELIKDINSRLENEEHEFVELSHFIKETKSYLDEARDMSDKDQKAMELLVRIDNELAHVHYLHSSLLHESIELKTTALDAASESLYYAGITSFNFDSELARKMTNVPLPFMEARTLLKPYLSLKQFETWSPLAVFAPQHRDTSNKDKSDLVFIDAIDDIQEDKHERQKAMKEVLYILSQARDIVGCSEMVDISNLGSSAMMFETDDISKDSIDDDKITLKRDEPLVKALIISKLRAFDQVREYMDTREFAECCIILHQMSPVDVKEIIEQDEHVLHMGVKEYFSQVDYIYAKELDSIISLGQNYEMKDVAIWTGGKV